MNVYMKSISRLIDERILVEVYVDIFSTTITGYILRVSQDWMVIYSFDDNFQYSGIAIIQNENISRIRWEGNRINNMKRLIPELNKGDKAYQINVDDLESCIASLKDIYGYVTVHIEHVDTSICFIGSIVGFDQYSLVLKEYGTLDNMDRNFIHLEMFDITKLEVDAIYEKKLKKLHEQQSGFTD